MMNEQSNRAKYGNKPSYCTTNNKSDYSCFITTLEGFIYIITQSTVLIVILIPSVEGKFGFGLFIFGRLIAHDQSINIIILTFKHVEYKYQMQGIFNEPIIKNFLSSINPEEHPSTIRELILIGINVVSSKIHKNIQEKENIHHNQINQNEEIDLVRQLQNMKGRIDELTQIVLKRSRKVQEQEALISFNPNKKKTITFHEQNKQNKAIKVNHLEQEELKKEDIKITPKVTEIVPPEDAQTFQPCNRRRMRHHLDDSQVRKVLANPYAREQPSRPKSKKLQKKYQYQQQINKEQLRMIKSIHCEEENAINRSRRSKTATNQFNVQSKIKNLIAQDKFKFKKTNIHDYDYNKYQYSDDESQYQEIENKNEPSSSHLYESSHQNYQYSSFKQPNEKRQEREEEYDVVSNSSSFSRFSLGSQRQTGKISNRKKRN